MGKLRPQHLVAASRKQTQIYSKRVSINVITYQISIGQEIINILCTAYGLLQNSSSFSLYNFLHTYIAANHY